MTIRRNDDDLFRAGGVLSGPGGGGGLGNVVSDFWGLDIYTIGRDRGDVGVDGVVLNHILYEPSLRGDL